jgi:hypothetical protein
MFAIAGIVLLLVHGSLRPDQHFLQLQSLPLLALLIALALFGLAIDLKLRRSQLAATPQLGFALALAAWILVGVPVREAALSFALFFTIAQGVQSFRALATVSATILALALVAALLGVAHARDALYDPDELAITVAVAVPLAFAFFEHKRTAGRVLLVLVALGAIGVCVILTQSRGGQIVLATVLAVHLVVRYRARGFVVAAMVAAALLKLGGGAWGPLPARDPIALLLASALVYVSFKILVVVLREYADDSAAAVARTWARALVASLAGLSVALVFLPPAHDLALFLYTGLAGALYQATRAHDPKLAIRFDRRDLVRLAAIDAGILGALCL